MEFPHILYYIIGAILVIQFLRYVLTAQSLLGLVLRKPEITIINRESCPQYIRDFYQSKEKELCELGFQYCFCIFQDDIFLKKNSKRYFFFFYNPDVKSFASVAASNVADKFIPYEVSFTTNFKNGKRLMTLNGIKHSVLGKIPNTTLVDAYAETTGQQFDFHRDELKKFSDWEIDEFDEKKIDPQKIINRESGFYEDYFTQLEKDGYVYKTDDDKFLIKTLHSIGLAHKFIIGWMKISVIRKQLIKRGEQTDVPVELEMENYENSKYTLNQKIKNTSGKLFFLILSIVLFGVAFGLLFSFEFVLVLIAVVFIHESGHLLAMRFFGYKNLRMLFVPLFGAVAMGTDKGVKPHKKIITYFAGPVPGLLIGLVLFIWYQTSGNPFLFSSIVFMAILMFLIINLFNLLPIMPFDGGQIFNTIIFSRFNTLQLIFNLISIAVIVGIGIVLNAPILFFIALLVLLGIQQYFIKKKLSENLKKKFISLEHVSETDFITESLMMLREKPYDKYPFQKKFQLIQMIENSFNAKKASLRTVFITLAVYLIVFVGPILYVIFSFYLPYKNVSIKDPCEIVRKIPKPTEVYVEKSRFERLNVFKPDEIHMVINRSCFKSEDEPIVTYPRGDFLARIWALYGEPDRIDNEFAYTFLDREKNIIFTAGLRYSMPSYRFREEKKEKVVAALYLFEKLLKKTDPVDCSFKYVSLYGTYEIGCMDGKPYYKQALVEEPKAVVFEPIQLKKAVRVDAFELDRMLYLYTSFIAIGRDKWRAAEASMVQSQIEVSGLPENFSKEEQLMLFPAVQKELKKKEALY